MIRAGVKAHPEAGHGALPEDTTQVNLPGREAMPRRALKIVRMRQGGKKRKREFQAACIKIQRDEALRHVLGSPEGRE